MSFIAAVVLGIALSTIVIAAAVWLLGKRPPQSGDALGYEQIKSELRVIDGLAQIHDAFWRAMQAIDCIERGRRP